VSARHRHIKNDIRDADRADEYLTMLIAAYNAVLGDRALRSDDIRMVLAKRRDELDVELVATRARATMLRKQLATMPKKVTR
jgi:F0F1-type ATP synthase membrane subunit b/b'